MGVTMKEIARQAGVSIASVSRVINNKYLNKISLATQNRIRKVIEEHKFAPSAVAVNLSKQKIKTIGFLFRHYDLFQFSYYLDEMIRGILICIESRGYRLMIIPQNEDKSDSLKKLIRSRTVDGMILFGTSIDDAVIKEVQEEKFPFIVVNNYSKETPFPYVDCNNVQGARLAVNHLYSKGKRRIAFIGGSVDSRNALDRKIGYMEGLKQNGLAYNEKLFFQGAFMEESGKKAVEYFLHLDQRPDAIFAADDIMAFGAIRALKKNGIKIPEEMAVAGFDNSELAEMIEPPLTTINHPIMDIGKKSAEMLLDLVDGKKIAEQFVIEPELIVREST